MDCTLLKLLVPWVLISFILTFFSSINSALALLLSSTDCNSACKVEIVDCTLLKLFVPWVLISFILTFFSSINSVLASLLSSTDCNSAFKVEIVDCTLLKLFVPWILISFILTFFSLINSALASLLSFTDCNSACKTEIVDFSLTFSSLSASNVSLNFWMIFSTWMKNLCLLFRYLALTLWVLSQGETIITQLSALIKTWAISKWWNWPKHFWLCHLESGLKI